MKMEVENLLATRMPRGVVFARSPSHREFHRQTVPDCGVLEPIWGNWADRVTPYYGATSTNCAGLCWNEPQTGDMY